MDIQESRSMFKAHFSNVDLRDNSHPHTPIFFTIHTPLARIHSPQSITLMRILPAHRLIDLQYKDILNQQSVMQLIREVSKLQKFHHLSLENSNFKLNWFHTTIKYFCEIHLHISTPSLAKYISSHTFNFLMKLLHNLLFSLHILQLICLYFTPTTSEEYEPCSHQIILSISLFLHLLPFCAQTVIEELPM